MAFADEPIVAFSTIPFVFLTQSDKKKSSTEMIFFYFENEIQKDECFLCSD